MPLLVAGLVDADRAQAVEAAPPVGLLERGGHAGAYAAHGAPVDAHELGEGAPAHVQGEPRDLVLERRGEPARGRARPGRHHGPDAVLGALDAGGRPLNEASRRADVGRAPPPRRERVVALAAPAAHGAPRCPPAGPRRHDYGIPLDSDALDDGGAQLQGLLEYTVSHAAARLPLVGLSWSKVNDTRGASSPLDCGVRPPSYPHKPPKSQS